MPKLIDICGQRFGRWTVLEQRGCTKANGAYWLCRCDCGAEKLVNSRALRGHQSTSCGCYIRELKSKMMIEMHTTHGRSKTAMYRSWSSMRRRCNDKNDPAWPQYGGRGIFVCERWATSFQNFLNDMGERPAGGTLDRVDNDGPYSPENCRWTDWSVQQNNRRSNVRIEYEGRIQTLQQWANELQIDRRTISQRLSKGWPMDRVFRPVSAM